MIIDCISDLHGFKPELQGGDLLIVAGDLTARDTYQEYIDVAEWLRNQDYKEIIIIAGNHDTAIEKCDIAGDIFYEFNYLEDDGTYFEGLNIYGSPWTLTFPGMNQRCKAFTKENDEELKKRWHLIPNDTDILITHMPPNGIFDQTFLGEYVGSESLREMVISNKFQKLKAHIFGHIHEHGGSLMDTSICKFINASIMNEVYDPVNKPVRIEL